METKETLLGAVSTALETGTITKNDLRAILDKHESKSAERSDPNRVSAVDVMFYVAGIVLFAGIAALIGQSWDSGITTRVLLSAGFGTLFWAAAIYLVQSATKSDIRNGMTNALLLAGSLSLIAGGFIIANEFVDFAEFNFYATAITLALLGGLHILFGWQIKRDLLVLLGVLLAVSAFPATVFGLLQSSGVPLFVNCLIVAVSSGILIYATRVASWIGASSTRAARAFDSLGTFGILMSLYVASYDDGSGLFWLFALIICIVGLFYLSITMQNKLLLGNGSLFLVIAVITISFRYFSGYGVATSLFIGALGLIGTAITAAIINRRYIK